MKITYPSQFYCSSIYMPDINDSVLYHTAYNNGGPFYGKPPIDQLFWWRPMKAPVKISDSKHKEQCSCCNKYHRPSYYYRDVYRTPLGGIGRANRRLCESCLKNTLNNRGVVIPLKGSQMYADYIRYQVNKIPKDVGYLSQCANGKACAECKWKEHCNNTIEIRTKVLQQQQQRLAEIKSKEAEASDLLFSKFWVKYVVWEDTKLQTFIFDKKYDIGFNTNRFFIEKNSGRMFFYTAGQDVIKDPLESVDCDGVRSVCTPFTCKFCTVTHVNPTTITVDCAYGGSFVSGTFFTNNPEVANEK